MKPIRKDYYPRIEAFINDYRKDYSYVVGQIPVCEAKANPRRIPSLVRSPS